jgi:PhnB protein
MAEQNLIERLDAAIDAILAARRAGLAAAEPELAQLLVIAGDLHGLPDPEFKRGLRADLTGDQEARMTIAETTSVQTLIPYLVVNEADQMIAFLKEAFDAELRTRVTRPDGTVMHAQVGLFGSALELAEPPKQGPAFSDMANQSALHVYVPDVDRWYERALRAGATSLGELRDQAYGDREGSVRDRWGNHWYLATHQEDVSEEELMQRFAGKGSKPRRDPSVPPVPAGWRSLIPYLHVTGAERQIEFLTRALGATELERTPAQGGMIKHATFTIGDSTIELSEAHGQWQPMPMHFHLYVGNVDDAYARAVGEGGTSVFAPGDMPYGERMACVRDAAGNQWYLAKML